MQNTALKAREKYEKKLAKAITKSGGIELEYQGQDITAVTIAEPRGLYAVDDVDEIVTIELIFQEVSTGKVMAYNEEYGMMEFYFDFVGSKEECYKYLLDTKEENVIEVSKMVLTKRSK